MKVVARETRSSKTLSAEAKIRVNILDSNDNIPQFSKETYEATIKEDAAPGTFVTRIYATDRDTGNYGKIRYTAINGPIAELMNLDPDTGEVTLTSSQGLDRENVPKYTLTIEARDDLGRGNRNVTRLEIRLLDINDNKPVFEQPRYDAILNSDLSGFDQKIFIKAKDPDAAGTNNKLTYRILNGPHSDRFRINQATGELTLTRPITSGSQSSATPVVLRVQADDGGSPSQQTTIEVQIHTQDYLNRTIQFIISRPINDVRANKDNVERSLSKLTGSRVNIYYLEPLEGQNEKTVAKAWVAFPQNSTVNTEEVQSAVSNINDREYSQKKKPRKE
ncbi:cadherin-86C-like [Tachypleus tridentatus]|uniref:cadherin-86C-like n=1 Tax=Tachypleus tridentatus TaxID=6853 RepID=UPI003FD39EBF